MDREKIFDALRNCITEPKCRDCPWEECERFDCKKANVPVNLLLDVLELLKEQEPVKPTWSQGKAYCGNCGQKLSRKCDGIERRYCSFCGKEVKWE